MYGELGARCLPRSVRESHTVRIMSDAEVSVSVCVRDKVIFLQFSTRSRKLVSGINSLRDRHAALAGLSLE